MGEKILQLEIIKKSNDHYYGWMDENLNDDNEFQQEIFEFFDDNDENDDQEKSNLLL